MIFRGELEIIVFWPRRRGVFLPPPLVLVCLRALFGVFLGGLGFPGTTILGFFFLGPLCRFFRNPVPPDVDPFVPRCAMRVLFPANFWSFF